MRSQEHTAKSGRFVPLPALDLCPFSAGHPSPQTAIAPGLALWVFCVPSPGPFKMSLLPSYLPFHSRKPSLRINNSQYLLSTYYVPGVI